MFKPRAALRNIDAGQMQSEKGLYSRYTTVTVEMVLSD